MTTFLSWSNPKEHKILLPSPLVRLPVLSLNEWVCHYRSWICWKNIGLWSYASSEKMSHWLLSFSDKGKCSFSRRQNWQPFLLTVKVKKYRKWTENQIKQNKKKITKEPWTITDTKHCFSLHQLLTRFTSYLLFGFIYPITVTILMQTLLLLQI